MFPVCVYTPVCTRAYTYKGTLFVGHRSYYCCDGRKDAMVFQGRPVTCSLISMSDTHRDFLATSYHSLDCSVGESFWAMWQRALMAFMLKRGGFRSAGRGRNHGKIFSKEARQVEKSGLLTNETPSALWTLRVSSVEPRAGCWSLTVHRKAPSRTRFRIMGENVLIFSWFLHRLVLACFPMTRCEYVCVYFN